MSDTAPSDPPLARTPLHALHVAHGARMVPFAGFEMPVQYRGMIAEHEHTRAAASLFDVAHMGIASVEAPDRSLEETAAALETVVPGGITTLAPDRSRYTFLTNDRAGIVDDLFVSHTGSGFTLVLNAARIDTDLAHLQEQLPSGVRIELRRDRGLLALQGPHAVNALGRLAPEVRELSFMDGATVSVDGVDVRVSRSGYTGEDGFELAAAADDLAPLAERMLAQEEVAFAGLGARDSLRLEAGLCLYGQDLDETTTPVEAGLTWAIPKRRRGPDGGYPGAETVARQLEQGPERVRVGVRLVGRRLARPGAELTDPDTAPLGPLTSGSHGPTVGGPIGMGYVPPTHTEPGTPLVAVERGRPLDAQVAALPFVPHRVVR
ncbi:glycine cleavage system aminomethyltransferase GcvT [Egibacter rhizosphaerae]|uniref:aminomethyltransferase n=1 Tax=Egibacter rhizosphaerae TaxID=1670831 RepID=A0A411YF10_9ACTN|nr:glycine cleavage system aminomethyltransferase GcvT [Egibacter rhizosphaerae]QBI19808.1 glycine cleavage system aminomethyltransferase GcvT [Egibacter rhizosphaerae]